MGLGCGIAQSRYERARPHSKSSTKAGREWLAMAAARENSFTILQRLRFDCSGVSMVFERVPRNLEVSPAGRPRARYEQPGSDELGGGARLGDTFAFSDGD